jgi:hypothetical protein
MDSVREGNRINPYMYCCVDIDADKDLKFIVKRYSDGEVLLRTNSFSEAYVYEEKFNTAFIMGIELGKLTSSTKRNP